MEVTFGVSLGWIEVSRFPPHESAKTKKERKIPGYSFRFDGEFGSRMANTSVITTPWLCAATIFMSWNSST
jgi:hypothetical protein